MNPNETKLLKARDVSAFLCFMGVLMGVALLGLLWLLWDGPFNPKLTFNPHKFLGWSAGLSLCFGALFGFRWHILKGRYNARYLRKFEG